LQQQRQGRRRSSRGIGIFEEFIAPLWRSCGIKRVGYGRRRKDELNSKEMQSSRYTHTVRPGYTAVVVGCGGVGGSGRRENKEKDRGNGVT
jgi:hypothetical protein